MTIGGNSCISFEKSKVCTRWIVKNRTICGEFEESVSKRARFAPDECQRFVIEIRVMLNDSMAIFFVDALIAALSSRFAFKISLSVIVSWKKSWSLRTFQFILLAPSLLWVDTCVSGTLEVNATIYLDISITLASTTFAFEALSGAVHQADTTCWTLCLVETKVPVQISRQFQGVIVENWFGRPSVWIVRTSACIEAGAAGVNSAFV